MPRGPTARGSPVATVAWQLLGNSGSFRDPTNSSELATLRQQLGVDSSLDRVDFQDEVVVHFGAALSSGCDDVLLDDVVIKKRSRLVYAEFISAVKVRGRTVVCASDLKPWAYVVALERSALPESPFTLQLYDEIRCQRCDLSEQVTVDLGTAPE